MKEMYEAPKAEVTVFEIEDSIAASNLNSNGLFGLEDVFGFDEE